MRLHVDILVNDCGLLIHATRYHENGRSEQYFARTPEELAKEKLTMLTVRQKVSYMLADLAEEERLFIQK